jgi:hypothetical protein
VVNFGTSERFISNKQGCLLNTYFVIHPINLALACDLFSHGSSAQCKHFNNIIIAVQLPYTLKLNQAVLLVNHVTAK